VDTPPSNKNGAVVLARAAIDAYDWSTARSALAGFAATNPSQAVCLMMAEIEEGETGDQGKAREWLNRAVRAPRDPVWTADGITAEEWEPVSPVTGRLDAFEWRVPTSAVATRIAGNPALPPEGAPGAGGGDKDKTPLALPDS
jgi:HemY protein